MTDNITKYLNKFEIYILKKILKKLIKQGYQEQKIIAFFKLFFNMMENEYNETHIISLESHIIELLIQSFPQKSYGISYRFNFKD
jgi:hypothetical protein